MTEDQSGLKLASQKKRCLTIAFSIVLALLAMTACARYSPDRPATQPQPVTLAPEGTQTPTDDSKVAPTASPAAGRSRRPSETSTRAGCPNDQPSLQEEMP